MGAPTIARRQKRILLGITFAHALSHAYILAFPVLLPFIREELLLTYKELGLLSGVLLVAYGLTTFPSGWLADIIGIRNVLIAYLAILAISSVTLLFVNSFPALLVLASFIGLIAGFYHPPGLSLISQSFPPEDLGKMFGVHGVSGNVGSAIAPSLAVLVASTKYGWKAALLPFGMLSILAIPAFLAISTPTPKSVSSSPDFESPSPLQVQEENKHSPNVFIRPLILILLISILVGLIDRGMIAFLTVYLVDDRHYSPVIAGFIVSISFVIAIAGQIAFGILSDSKGAITGFRLATLAIIILCLLIPFVPGVLLLVILILVTFALTGTQPPLSILTTSVSSLEKRGTVFGLQFISVFGVGGVGGFLAGVIASLYGLDAIYFVLGGLGVLTFLVLLIYPRWAPPIST